MKKPVLQFLSAIALVFALSQIAQGQTALSSNSTSQNAPTSALGGGDVCAGFGIAIGQAECDYMLNYTINYGQGTIITFNYDYTAPDSPPNEGYFIINDFSTTGEVGFTSAVNYAITIVDNFGCTASISGAMVEPLGHTPDVNLSYNSPCANDNNGSISIFEINGQSCNFHWSTGTVENATSFSSIYEVGSGDYSIQIEDADYPACSTTTNFTLEAYPAVQSFISWLGQTAGVQIPEGASYNIQWYANNSFVATGSTLDCSIFPTGTMINALVVDNNTGCTKQSNTLLYAANQAPCDVATQTISSNATPADFENCAGYATIYFVGSSPYVASVVPPNGQEFNYSSEVPAISLVDMCAGEWTITVADGNGCNSQLNFMSPSAVSTIETSLFEVYPNPTQDFIFVKGMQGLSQVELYSVDGSLLRVFNNVSPNSPLSLHEMASGFYTVLARSSNGVSVAKVFKD